MCKMGRTNSCPVQGGRVLEKTLSRFCFMNNKFTPTNH
jgi:hypothetical protein